jgi:hypothetical protein
MKDGVDRAGYVETFRDVLVDEAEPGVVHQVRDVLQRPGQEVVDAHDVTALAQELLAQVRPDEPGPAGDHNPL